MLARPRRLLGCPTSSGNSLRYLNNQSPGLLRWRPHSTSSHDQPTIFAVATPPGKSAIALVRISGPNVAKVWDGLRKRDGSGTGSWPPPARKALLRQIRCPTTSTKLDEGLVLYFPAKNSLTAQDMLELHLHGSTAVIKAVLSSLSRLDGFRPAEPGEFTRLAFDSGRMDLTEVEGLRDLIESETEIQRKLAVEQAGGSMRKAYEHMRREIISAMSVMEALIDFGEDENIDDSAYEPARRKIIGLRDTIAEHLHKARQGEIIRNGAKLAIFGAPNAGKSSLVNWLVQREASIVTSHAGTTRDVLELSLDFRGYPLIICDTAGLRSTPDEVESIGVDRAIQTVQNADIKLCMIALSEVDFDKPILDPITASLVDDKTLYVLNKADLRTLTPERLGQLRNSLGIRDQQDFVVVSILQKTGLSELSSRLFEEVEGCMEIGTSGGALLVTRERHRYHLEDCMQCLNTFLGIDPATDLVGAAEELRYASYALGRVTGQVQVDEILDELFSSFCIGK